MDILWTLTTPRFPEYLEEIISKKDARTTFSFKCELSYNSFDEPTPAEVFLIDQQWVFFCLIASSMSEIVTKLLRHLRLIIKRLTRSTIIS